VLLVEVLGIRYKVSAHPSPFRSTTRQGSQSLDLVFETGTGTARQEASVEMKKAKKKIKKVPPRTIDVKEWIRRLEAAHGDARQALEFSTPLELLIALILAAQCTD
jgi:hypothetical protein